MHYVPCLDNEVIKNWNATAIQTMVVVSIKQYCILCNSAIFLIQVVHVGYKTVFMLFFPYYSAVFAICCSNGDRPYVK